MGNVTKTPQTNRRYRAITLGTVLAMQSREPFAEDYVKASAGLRRQNGANMISPEHDEQTVEKITRRYVNLAVKDPVTRVLEKYTRRLEAIKRFTDRVVRNGWVDEAEIETLRAVGVGEAEIKGLIEQYAKLG